jgi:hypothetical protein
MVNIKLDKTGGLTEALALRAAARGRRVRGHGRLHGGIVARHGARDPPGAGGGDRGPRRPAPPGRGPGRAAQVRGALGVAASIPDEPRRFWWGTRPAFGADRRGACPEPPFAIVRPVAPAVLHQTDRYRPGCRRVFSGTRRSSAGARTRSRRSDPGDAFGNAALTWPGAQPHGAFRNDGVGCAVCHS